MKNPLKKLVPLICLVVLGAFLSSVPNAVGQKNSGSTLLAGIAKENITPQVPIPMSGYGGRDDPFKGVHDSIYVTAAVFFDGSQTAALITADLIGFSHSFCDETIQKIEQETGIKKDYILLSANHNHGGPVNKTYGNNVSPDVEKYVSELQKRCIRAAVRAKEKLQPAMIGMGVGTCNMNINRRARFADGTIWLGRNPDGPCDHDVSVIRIDDLNKKPIGIFVNWPCHGTASGQENYKITGDWMGAASGFVEEAFGENVVVPVTAGASADINPIYGPNDNFNEIEAVGMLVGEEAVRVANTIQTFPNGNIEAIKMTVTANGKKPLESRAPNQKLESGDKVPINLSALKIGNIVFAGISGELMTEIGMRIKTESPYKNTVVITHCNGSSGYLCTNLAYPEGGYEVQVSRVMPGTEYLISDNLKKMIRSFK